MELEYNGVKHDINVDVLEELSPYNFDHKRVKVDEMVACSPFRNERKPSFSINLSTGLWIDFGSEDLFQRGNLVNLLSFLRNETIEEVIQYLLNKYEIDYKDVDSLQLGFDLTIAAPQSKKIISLEEYSKYGFRSPYLATRGVSEKVQRAFKVGYDKKGGAVALPWFDKDGNIVNIKFRSTKSKKFYYYKGGQAIRNHIYGMHFVYKMNIEKVYLVESEIDALYLWSCGFPAIALGGSNVSKAQVKLLLRSPIKLLILATDNDLVGMEIRERVKKDLIGAMELKEVFIPSEYKDVNDIQKEVIKDILSQLYPCSLSIL